MKKILPLIFLLSIASAFCGNVTISRSEYQNLKADADDAEDARLAAQTAPVDIYQATYQANIDTAKELRMQKYQDNFEFYESLIKSIPDPSSQPNTSSNQFPSNLILTPNDFLSQPLPLDPVIDLTKYIDPVEPVLKDTKNPANDAYNIPLIRQHMAALDAYDMKMHLLKTKKEFFDLRKQNNLAAISDSKQAGHQYSYDSNGIARPKIDPLTGVQAIFLRTSTQDAKDIVFSQKVALSHKKTAEYFPQVLNKEDPIHAVATKIWKMLLLQNSPLCCFSSAPFIVYSMAAAEIGVKPSK